MRSLRRVAVGASIVRSAESMMLRYAVAKAAAGRGREDGSSVRTEIFIVALSLHAGAALHLFVLQCRECGLWLWEQISFLGKKSFFGCFDSVVNVRTLEIPTLGPDRLTTLAINKPTAQRNSTLYRCDRCSKYTYI